MMEWLFAPLEVLRRDLERIKTAVDSTVDPLNPVKKDMDRIAARVKLPPLPGIPRRTEEERVAYGIEPPLRGTGFTRLLDLLGLSISKGSIGNPIPA